MKNPLKKPSGDKRNDRREALEHEAAERIKEAGAQAPPRESPPSWIHPPAESHAPEGPGAAQPATAEHSEHSPAGRRLTVQERMAGRN